jgi:hypothetical protein
MAIGDDLEPESGKRRSNACREYNLREIAWQLLHSRKSRVVDTMGLLELEKGTSEPVSRNGLSLLVSYHWSDHER